MSRILVLMLLILHVGAAGAQTADLYTGEVPVDGRSPSERTEAIPSALIHVLQKLSGQREIPPAPALDHALATAEQMMLAYSYADRERLTPSGEVERTSWLVVRFLPSAVDGVLADLGLPRWRPDRPPVAVWVAVEDDTGRRLMPVEYDYAWDAMRAVARHRGLPLAWPDRAKWSPGPGQTADEAPPEVAGGLELGLLWGGFTDQLPALAGARGVVTVAARRAGPEWDVRWTHGDGAESEAWRTRGRALSLALVEGVHLLVDRIAARDTIGTGIRGAWEQQLTIERIANASDYARCLTYLEELTVVESLKVRSARPGQVALDLVLNAEPRFLDRLLRRDGVLEAAPAPGVWVLLSGDPAGSGGELQ